MQIAFDPTITLGTLGSTLVVLGGVMVISWRIGVYIGRVEAFMKESTTDRANIRTSLNEQSELLFGLKEDIMSEKSINEDRHLENVGKLARLFKRFLMDE